MDGYRKAFSYVMCEAHGFVYIIQREITNNNSYWFIFYRKHHNQFLTLSWGIIPNTPTISAWSYAGSFREVLHSYANNSWQLLPATKSPAK